jgi:hypothetical protein
MPMEYSNYGGMSGLKTWSWAIADVFYADGSGHIITGCERHFPLEITDKDGSAASKVTITADSDDVSPIFADDELDFYPVCDICGEEHTYMSLTEYGEEELQERHDRRDSSKPISPRIPSGDTTTQRLV